MFTAHAKQRHGSLHAGVAVSDRQSRPQSQRFRARLVVPCFFVAATLGCWAIGLALPFREVPVVGQKIDFLLEHGDQFDTLFLGSSRVQHQILPDVFDRLMADAGQPTRSFNLAADSMRPPEDSFVLERVLQARTKPLRWVFLESNTLRVRADPGVRGTRRAIYWHDSKRLYWLFRDAFDAARSGRTQWFDNRRAVDFFEHAEAWFDNATNLGRLTAFADGLETNAAALPSWNDLGSQRDGFVPAARPQTMSGKDLADYRRQLAERRQKPALLLHFDVNTQAMFDEEAASIVRAGGQPVLLIPPTTTTSRYYPRADGKQRFLVLDFSSPVEYPELFVEEYRLDTTHLNTRGAEAFTAVLVRRLLEIAHRSP